MWVKKGLIIEPQNNLWWMKSHAMLPTVDQVEEDLYKVYFSGRDENNRSQIGCAYAKVNNESIEVLKYSEDPVLTNGDTGCFDDNGVTPSCIVNDGDVKRMYYIGWNSGTTTTRMSLIMGMAISTDHGETFVRNSRAPLLIPTDREPFNIATAPCVLKEKDIWHMWYVSGEGWISKDLPIYNIKHAYSNDGVNWTRNGTVCIDFESEKETALARPWVIKEGDTYKMWFSYKDPAVGYRIGVATSNDAVSWNRNNNSGIDISERGWDDKMIEYSCVFENKGVRYMLYNGNNYGESGIGYAVQR